MAKQSGLLCNDAIPCVVAAADMSATFETGKAVPKVDAPWQWIVRSMLGIARTFSSRLEISPRKVVIDVLTSGLAELCALHRYVSASECFELFNLLDPARLWRIARSCQSQNAAGEQQACHKHSYFVASVGSRSIRRGLLRRYRSGLPWWYGSCCSAANRSNARHGARLQWHLA